MAKDTKTVLTCDIDGTEAQETVRFGLDGLEYEMELCPDHLEEFNSGFGRYASIGRRVGGPVRRRRAQRAVATPAAAAPSRRRRSRGAGKPNLQEVREWARGQGHTVSDRGRIPRAVLEAYDQAH